MGKRDRNLYYGKKLLLFLGSVFLLSVVVFYVARLAPGDPLVSYYGDRTEKEFQRNGNGPWKNWG